MGTGEGRDAGQMACRACGWWPPLVRVRKGTTERATDSWRWRRLYEHVCELADVEEEDGQMDGPHQRLEQEITEAAP